MAKQQKWVYTDANQNLKNAISIATKTMTPDF